MDEQRPTRPWFRRRPVMIAGLVTIPMICAAAMLGVGLLLAFRGVDPPVDGAKLGPATTVVDGYVAAYVLDAGGGEIALVDAGQDPEGLALLDALREIDRGPRDVGAILLTHGHPDHRAAAQLFPNARIYAHERELPLLRGEVAARGPVPRLSGRLDPLDITHPVADGATFEIGVLRVRAFHVPGHTEGSVAWLVDDVLFVGDSATSKADGTLEPSPWVFTDDTRRNRESLATLAARIDGAGASVEHLVFSHAAPLRGMDPLRRWASAHGSAPEGPR